jgi:predicted phosphodiesterase
MKGNVLVIADTHEPFTHENYLSFCKDVYREHDCDTVVHIGDLVDNHAISYHDHDPNGMSAGDEYQLTLEKVQLWTKVFPRVKLCKGNHDLLMERKALTYGIPKPMYKSFKEMWQLPKGWEYEYSYVIDDVKYEHGLGRSGQYAHIKAAQANMQSTVMGHLHANAGVGWSANDLKIVFGMAVGCGIDRTTYAFKYGTSFVKKPILGAGVVTHHGSYAMFVPMDL